MANVAQILTVIDCASILNNPAIAKGKIGSETSIGSYATSDAYIFMIGSNDYLASNQGKSELTVGARSGDVVQWTVTDPTSGQQYSPILYGFTTQSEAISSPLMLDLKLNVYQPASTSQPTGPFKAVSYQDYVWEATVTQPGTQIQYFWKFAILDQDGNVLGAYSWDPFIAVS